MHSVKQIKPQATYTRAVTNRGRPPEIPQSEILIARDRCRVWIIPDQPGLKILLHPNTLVSQPDVPLELLDVFKRAVNPRGLWLKRCPGFAATWLPVTADGLPTAPWIQITHV